MPEPTEEQQKELEEKLKSMSPEELKEFQKQQCIFCQIIAGKVPAKKVYEDEKCLAVLDINPATKGHLLIMPKEHYAIMPQVPEAEIGHLFLVSKYLSQLLLKVLKAGGTTVFVANGLAAGQRAQHFLLHLIPRKEGDKILAVEEKLVEPSLPEKVKALVEKKFNGLMGIKKEIITAGELVEEAREVKEEKAGEKERKDKSAGGQAEPMGEEETQEKEEVREEKEEEPEEESEEKSEEPKEEIKTRKKTAPRKGKEEKSQEKGKEDEDNYGVTLDEIAELFK